MRFVNGIPHRCDNDRKKLRRHGLAESVGKFGRIECSVGFTLGWHC
jgi:hypothetical protein